MFISEIEARYRFYSLY